MVDFIGVPVADVVAGKAVVGVLKFEEFPKTEVAEKMSKF